MRAGLLNEQVEILTSTLEKNDYGEQTETWTTTYTTKARLIHDSGDRTEINDEVFYAYTKTFQMRQYVPVEEYNRIKWNNKIFRILSITPDKHQQNLTVKTELVND